MNLRKSTSGSTCGKYGLGVAALLFASNAYADSPAPERQYTVTSPNGAYSFTMHPNGRDGTSIISAYGEAFRTPGDGDTKADAAPIWRVDGWYAFETFISDDGRGLVRLGPWASNPQNEELAIALYRDGQEIRRYTVAELIDDPESVQRSVSHYKWQKREGGYPRFSEGNRFELLTVEGQVKAFDIESGELYQKSEPLALQVTREDADDRFFAANLFRENEIEIDERTIGRVIRSNRGTIVWVDATFSGLPVFYHAKGYKFDDRRKILFDQDTGAPRIWGESLPPSNAFPIDHRPDITPEEAIRTWLVRVRSHRFFSDDYEPRTKLETVLGFHNLAVGSSGEPVYRLAWRVRPKGVRNPVAMISAKKGDILHFDSGVRTGHEPTKSVDAHVDRFAGNWSAAPCSQRGYRRELTLGADGEYAATDYLAPCPEDASCIWSGIIHHSGTWRIVNARMIELFPRPSSSSQGEPMPRAMGFDSETGRLHEATPGAPVLCEYRHTKKTAST